MAGQRFATPMQWKAPHSHDSNTEGVTAHAAAARAPL